MLILNGKICNALSINSNLFDYRITNNDLELLAKRLKGGTIRLIKIQGRYHSGSISSLQNGFDPANTNLWPIDTSPVWNSSRPISNTKILTDNAGTKHIIIESNSPITLCFLYDDKDHFELTFGGEISLLYTLVTSHRKLVAAC